MLEERRGSTGTRVSTWFPRGVALLRDPALNKSTAFTEAERGALGLRGLLPPHVSSEKEQVARVLENFRRLPTKRTRIGPKNTLVIPTQNKVISGASDGSLTATP